MAIERPNRRLTTILAADAAGYSRLVGADEEGTLGRLPIRKDLNPHAGEGGLFGRQDIDVSTPTIERMRMDGLNVSGPVPGDTVFVKLRAGQTMLWSRCITTRVIFR